MYVLTFRENIVVKIKQQTLEKLKPRQKIVLELRSSGLKMKDIGDQLSISKAAVHQIIKKIVRINKKYE